MQPAMQPNLQGEMSDGIREARITSRRRKHMRDGKLRVGWPTLEMPATRRGCVGAMLFPFFFLGRLRPPLLVVLQPFTDAGRHSSGFKPVSTSRYLGRYCMSQRLKYLPSAPRFKPDPTYDLALCACNVWWPNMQRPVEQTSSHHTCILQYIASPQCMQPVNECLVERVINADAAATTGQRLIPRYLPVGLSTAILPPQQY